MSLSFAVKQIKLWCFENVPLRGTQPPTVLVLWSSFVRRCFTLSSFHYVTHWSVWTESLIHLLSFCLPPSSWRSSWRKRWVTLKVWMRRPCPFAIASKTSSLSGLLRFLNLFLQNEFSFSEFHIPTSEKKSLVRLLLFSWTLTESRAVLDVVATQKGNGSLSFVSDLVSAQHVINHIWYYSIHIMYCNYGRCNLKGTEERTVTKKTQKKYNLFSRHELYTIVSGTWEQRPHFFCSALRRRLLIQESALEV